MTWRIILIELDDTYIITFSDVVGAVFETYCGVRYIPFKIDPINNTIWARRERNHYATPLDSPCLSSRQYGYKEIGHG